jgi:hypothetical protein
MSLVPKELLNKPSAPPAADKVSKSKTNDEIMEVVDITSPAPAPPLPPPSTLPPIQFVLIFVVNGKEIGERGIEIDVNQEFESFKNGLDELVENQMPNDVTIYGPFARVIYKRAYVTKAQSLKRKDLAWQDFKDKLDYAGLLRGIRESNTSKMTLVIRAFITVPQDAFEEQIQPLMASQRMVSFSSQSRLTVVCNSSAETGLSVAIPGPTRDRICRSSNAMALYNSPRQVLLQTTRQGSCR